MTVYDESEILEFRGDSWIEHVRYNKKTLEMTVEMKGYDPITCTGVPMDVFKGFKNAPSKGKYWNTNIRNKYKHEYFM